MRLCTLTGDCILGTKEEKLVLTVLDRDNKVILSEDIDFDDYVDIEYCPPLRYFITCYSSSNKTDCLLCLVGEVLTVTISKGGFCLSIIGPLESAYHDSSKNRFRFFGTKVTE